MSEDVMHKITDFPDQYISLRKREGRIYSDNEVAQLPEINKEHRYYSEWLIRKRSCDQLIKYLMGKERPLKILEVGCGNGWLSARLSAIPSVRVIGIDINIEELNQAKRVFNRINNLQFYDCTLENEMISLQKFDVIVFAASMQYFSSLKAVLNISLKSLKPNGEIHILNTHFYRSNEIYSARQRSAEYFQSIGFPEMTDHYFHQSLNEVKQFDHKILYDPHSILNKLKINRNPFYWICVNANA